MFVFVRSFTHLAGEGKDFGAFPGIIIMIFRFMFVVRSGVHWLNIPSCPCDFGLLFGECFLPPFFKFSCCSCLFRPAVVFGFWQATAPASNLTFAGYCDDRTAES